MHTLISHPAHPPSRIESVEARILGFDEAWLRLRWRVEGTQALVVPAFAGRGRAEDLWRTTCFELFLRPERGESYVEFNLSPSERWAAYDFTAYRDGMADRPMPIEPNCTLRRGSTMAIFDAAIPRVAIPAGTSVMNLAAVLEEEGGTLSYWALAQHAGAPDFHDAACFTGELVAPRAP